ncbi:hypothetical protein [Chitinophaga sp. S165]|uniref:hypothetical protein n=1 Tax=Chitinophaga sp. S165 TaxID=2135462 RepID=UPI000D7129D8|nr:hypothetical protein [Chitinophaga sp. S165]PWV50397.1 hypothetical protein C7475_10417 [Chitinophaga sp. S165]
MLSSLYNLRNVPVARVSDLNIRIETAVVTTNGVIAPATVQVTRSWNGSLCTTRIVNTGNTPVDISEVILAQAGKVLPSNTRFYAEGFQMLTQTSGTLEKPEVLDHFRAKRTDK